MGAGIKIRWCMDTTILYRSSRSQRELQNGASVTSAGDVTLHVLPLCSSSEAFKSICNRFGDEEIIRDGCNFFGLAPSLFQLS